MKKLTIYLLTAVFFLVSARRVFADYQQVSQLDIDNTNTGDCAGGGNYRWINPDGVGADVFGFDSSYFGNIYGVSYRSWDNSTVINLPLIETIGSNRYYDISAISMVDHETDWHWVIFINTGYCNNDTSGYLYNIVTTTPTPTPTATPTPTTTPTPTPTATPTPTPFQTPTYMSSDRLGWGVNHFADNSAPAIRPHSWSTGALVYDQEYFTPYRYPSGKVPQKFSLFVNTVPFLYGQNSLVNQRMVYDMVNPNEPTFPYNYWGDWSYPRQPEKVNLYLAFELHPFNADSTCRGDLYTKVDGSINYFTSFAVEPNVDLGVSTYGQYGFNAYNFGLYQDGQNYQLRWQHGWNWLNGYIGAILPYNYPPGTIVEYPYEVWCYQGGVVESHVQTLYSNRAGYPTTQYDVNTFKERTTIVFPNASGGGDLVPDEYPDWLKDDGWYGQNASASATPSGSPRNRACADGDLVCSAIEVVSTTLQSVFTFDDTRTQAQVEALRQTLLAKAPFAYVYSALTIDLSNDTLTEVVPTFQLPQFSQYAEAQTYVLPPELTDSLPNLRLLFKIVLWVSLLGYFVLLGRRLTQNV